eukprot:COSAG04_NODE_193_length_20833_cov_9.922205_17_plen_502_part_00
MSVAIAKPKKVHETLSHGALNLSIKHAENVSHAYFERLLGSRGEMGTLANAGAVLQEFLDAGDWGVLKWLDKLDAKSGSSNELHRGIRHVEQSDVVYAQLRVWSLLFHFVIRPMQTYTQNHASQADMIPLMNEYKELLHKLKRVTNLTDSLKELPWLEEAEPALITVASDAKVLRKDRQRDKLLRRRKEALAMIKNYGHLGAERKTTQMGLMPIVLKQMAQGMLDGLTRMMDPKYSSLWSMTAEEIANSELHLIPATSDHIERYFGLASWLHSAQTSRRTTVNTNFQLSIIETKLGDKLVDMITKNPRRVVAMLRRARKFRARFVEMINTRVANNLQQQIAQYKAAEQKVAAREQAKAADMQKMRAEAREWTHRPATDRSERRHTGPGAAPPSGPTVPTVTSLAAEAKAARGGTETQQEEAAKDMLVRWLTVFSKVHDLHTVKELSAVFFNPDTGRLRIKGDKALDTLIQDVAACSARLHGHGSPAGFPVGPPQAAAAAPQ